MKIKKRLENFLKDENGAMVATEAIFLYPFTIIVIFTMIYISLYIFQAMTLQSYAQKIAVVAAREVAYPGYIDLHSVKQSNGSVSSNVVSVFGTNAIDWESGATITIPNDAKATTIDAYRYIFSGIGENSEILNDVQKKNLTNAASSMVSKYSVLAGTGVTIQINATNYFVSQQVDVTITEKVDILGFVEAMGFKGNQISATATAAANDPDEYIRNVDLVFGIGDTLAEKLGIDTDKFSDVIDKVKSVLNKFNVK